MERGGDRGTVRNEEARKMTKREQEEYAREVLGLTEEQVEVAKLEAELEQARVDGVIDSWMGVPPNCFRPLTDEWDYSIWETANGSPHKWVCRVRYNAARAAVANVRELRAAKKAAPAPPPAPAETICVECAHVAPGVFGYLSPLCGKRAKRNPVTGGYVGPTCLSLRTTDAPCPDWEARPPQVEERITREAPWNPGDDTK